MDFRVRERSYPSSNTQIGTFYWTNNGAVKHKSPFITTVSPGVYEKCFDQLHEGPPFRTGGPFSLFRLTEPLYAIGGGNLVGRPYVGPGNTVIGPVKPGDNWKYGYTGSFVLGPRGESLGGNGTIPSSADSVRPMDPNNFDSLGARAYDKLRPKVERAGLFQTIGEMGSMPGMLRTTGKGFANIWQELTGRAGQTRRSGPDLTKLRRLSQAPKKVSDQFLNVQFGWKPFVKDVIDVCDVVVNFHDYVARLERNNDKWQRRRFAEEVLQSEDSISQATNMDSNMCAPFLDASIMVPKSGLYRVARQTMTRVWYEGSFKYYRPEFDKGVTSGIPGLKTARQALSLLGADITPTHLYQIMPWSWLADWFVNVKHNVQLFDDLSTGQVASRWFYVMRESYYRWEYQNRFSSYGGGVVDLKWYRSVHTKRRVGSESHFQFSLQPGTLSGMQLTILAALGISLAG